MMNLGINNDTYNSNDRYVVGIQQDGTLCLHVPAISESGAKELFGEGNFVILPYAKFVQLSVEPSRYVYRDGVVGLFNGNPCGFVEDPEWESKQLFKLKCEKYQEIIDSYKYACNHYVVNICKNYYANTSWIPTWNKLIARNCGQSEMPPIRVYVRKDGGQKFGLYSLLHLKPEEFERYLNTLEQAQFLILQPKKEGFIKRLGKASTQTDVSDIVVNYGSVLNEDIISEYLSKVEDTLF